MRRESTPEQARERHERGCLAPPEGLSVAAPAQVVAQVEVAPLGLGVAHQAAAVAAVVAEGGEVGATEPQASVGAVVVVAQQQPGYLGWIK